MTNAEATHTDNANKQCEQAAHDHTSDLGDEDGLGIFGVGLIFPLISDDRHVKLLVEEVSVSVCLLDVGINIILVWFGECGHTARGGSNRAIIVTNDNSSVCHSVRRCAIESNNPGAVRLYVGYRGLISWVGDGGALAGGQSGDSILSSVIEGPWSVGVPVIFGAICEDDFLVASIIIGYGGVAQYSRSISDFDADGTFVGVV